MILSKTRVSFVSCQYIEQYHPIKDLLRRILIHDPAQRARVIDIQNHKWMSKVYSQGKQPFAVCSVFFLLLFILLVLDGTESDHQLLKRMAYVRDMLCQHATFVCLSVCLISCYRFSA
jgi:hypothetical protein